MVCREGSVKFWIHTRRWESTKKHKSWFNFWVLSQLPKCVHHNYSISETMRSGLVRRRFTPAMCTTTTKDDKQRSDLVKQAILTNNSTVFLLHSIHSFVCYRLFSPMQFDTKKWQPSLAALRERKAY
jgi:hypothetical protein